MVQTLTHIPAIMFNLFYYLVMNPAEIYRKHIKLTENHFFIHKISRKHWVFNKNIVTAEN